MAKITIICGFGVFSVIDFRDVIVRKASYFLSGADFSEQQFSPGRIRDQGGGIARHIQATKGSYLFLDYIAVRYLLRYKTRAMYHIAPAVLFAVSATFFVCQLIRVFLSVEEIYLAPHLVMNSSIMYVPPLGLHL